ncbi:MAG: putative anti-sigma regulatory factor, serine/threonine protein kinase [Actinoallomurus sp.]|nr:putative anti-sigma regulatory factor, serine/threonine protein kinase [Actinoallomurus sp.]
MEVYPEGRELVWRRSFPGLAEYVRRAREFVGFLLADLPDVDDVILVVSEFAANALRHTASAQPGGRFLLEVRRWRDGAAVALTDQGSHKVPTIPEPDDLCECGRGLQTVRALASEWHWTGDRGGRTFTATFIAHRTAVLVSAISPRELVGCDRRESAVLTPDTA